MLLCNEDSKKASVKMRLFLFSFLVLLIVSSHLSTSYSSADSKKLKALYFKVPETIDRMAFGHREIIADWLWLRAIQDMDICEKLKDQKICTGESWLFRLLRKITDLSPRNRPVYAVGAVSLSVLTNDTVGARFLFDKGVQYFPKDWPILYRAAYFYLYEDYEPEKAADLLRRTAAYGGPLWTQNLAQKVENPSSRRVIAEMLIKDLENNPYSEEVIKKIKLKLQTEH